MNNTYDYNEYKRGEIYYIKDEVDTVGSEQKPGRPAVIVSNDKNNLFSGIVTVLYCTSSPAKMAKKLPTHVFIDSTNRRSVVLAEQPTTVSKDLIGDYQGKCTEDEMERIREALKIQLALSGVDSEEYDNVTRTEEREDYKAQYHLMKKMYDELLDKLIRNGK